MYKIGRELHHVVPTGVGRFQRFLDLLVNSDTLQIEVVTVRQHACYEKKFICLDLRDV